jgi:thiol-disulfide isomerase/thioredoxin
MTFKTSNLLITFLILLFIGCTPKNKNSFSISGKVENLTTQYIVFSKIENLQKKTVKIIDTLTVNKRGEFNTAYLLEPNIYTLTFDKKTIQLAIDKDQHLTIKGTSSENISIAGSPDTELLNAYEVFRKESLNRLVSSVRKQIKELKKSGANQTTIAELRELEVENYNKHLNELTGFIKENMGTSVAIYPTSIRWNGNENLPFLEALVDDFEEKRPTLEITQKLKDKIELLKKTSVGSIISNIEMPDSTNKIIDLDSIKKTYTLIDFWASWCPPCRTESVLLNELYTAYKSEGFEIYGISLDSKKDRWLKALDQDKRVWAEVSTTEGFDTPIAIEYGITALPTNFLVDSNGKIIAVNIHGKNLKEKITALFAN